MEMGLEAVAAVDTAGAAAELARLGDRATAVIATKKAAEIYGLEVMRANIEDEDHNTTRFVILSAEPDDATLEDGPVITSFIFTVRNVPAALYKAMGGFATNGVNMIKLESYVDGSFNVAQFYAEQAFELRAIRAEMVERARNSLRLKLKIPEIMIVTAIAIGVLAPSVVQMGLL